MRHCPVTRDMVAKSKIVTDYGRRMGINRETENMPNLLVFEHPVKSAENYLEEMKELNMRKTNANYEREMAGLFEPTNHFAELVNTMSGGSVRRRRRTVKNYSRKMKRVHTGGRDYRKTRHSRR